MKNKEYSMLRKHYNKLLKTYHLMLPHRKDSIDVNTEMKILERDLGMVKFKMKDCNRRYGRENKI